MLSEALGHGVNGLRGSGVHSKGTGRSAKTPLLHLLPET